ncbi:MAG: hypothetical protein ABI193_14945 [Minicystis sp.]
MATIDYARFTRVLNRCEEVAQEPGMKASVVLVYKEVLKGPSQAYLAADDGVTKAGSSFGKENKEALGALQALDGVYREARSVVAAFVTGIVLPDTLKTCRTDTDKVDAIEALVGIFDEHTGEKWADTLSSGDFGTRALVTIKEIHEAIEANKGLSEARTARAAAYGPAYEAYLKLKRVVRNALGPASKQYKRIHFRDANATVTEKVTEKVTGKEEPKLIVNGAPKSGDAPMVDP